MLKYKIIADTRFKKQPRLKECYHFLCTYWLPLAKFGPSLRDSVIHPILITAFIQVLSRR